MRTELMSTLAPDHHSLTVHHTKRYLAALLNVWHHPSPWQLMGLLAMWFTLVCNGPLWGALWQHLHHRGFEGVIVLLMGMVAITGLQFSWLSLLAWRPLVKPVGVALLLIAAVCASFMGQYGIVIDKGMLVNVWQTDALEVKGLLSVPLLLSILVLAGLPLWWLWRTPVARSSVTKQAWQSVLGAVLGLAVAVGAVLPIYKDAAALMRNDKTLRYRITPSNAVYASTASLLHTQQTQGELVPMGLDAKVMPPPAMMATSTRPPALPRLFLMVIGETARADHFGINGYERDTTPELTKAPILNFPHVTSCGTSTAVSLPCLFSVEGKERHQARKQPVENLLDVLQHAGYQVLWVDNQAGCKGVCERIHSMTTSASITPQLCQQGECWDEAMLHDLQSKVQSLMSQQTSQVNQPRTVSNAIPGVVVVLHQMGSHGPEYYRRSPADSKPFTPECRNANLGSCETSNIINAYDNSVRYTSRFLGMSMDWLKAQTQFDTAMLYVSDHGESLGEAGLYLHGMPYAIAPTTQTHVPMLTWLSPEWMKRQHLANTCLQQQTQKSWSHDNITPSTLGLLDVQTAVYQPELDIFAPCRTVADTNLVSSITAHVRINPNQTQAQASQPTKEKVQNS